MKSAAFIVMLLVVSLPASAQQGVPGGSGNPLQNICTSFMEQSGQGVSGDRNKLCTCLVQQTQSRLSKEEMQIYARAAEAGQAPPPAVMEKIVGIATTCLTTR
jgi:hypothetical protein